MTEFILPYYCKKTVIVRALTRVEKTKNLLLTGSSSLKTREKKRIKSTAEDLVMVYLE